MPVSTSLKLKKAPGEVIAPTHTGSLRKAIFYYLIFFFAPLFAFSQYLYSTQQNIQPPSLQGDCPAKAQYYALNAQKHDLIFLGDSRTYCGIHADIIDSYLLTHSANMANFAHWFPTQYPFFQFIVPHIPPNTVVVWSIGHANFIRCGDSIQPRYPIGFKNAFKYLMWGFQWKTIEDNIYHFNPWLQVLANSKPFHSAFLEFSNQIFWQSPNLVVKTASGQSYDIFDNHTKEAKSLQEKYLKLPHVSSVNITRDNDKINSVILYRDGGSYYRIELDSGYFRKKQQEIANQIADDKNYHETTFKADPEYWQNFVGILELFKQYHIHLIVNEVEEAPFHYQCPLFRQHCRIFMREKVKPYVETMGFTYIRADFDKLSNKDYFDYNHLNDIGSQKYDAMLSELLSPILKHR